MNLIKGTQKSLKKSIKIYLYVYMSKLYFNYKICTTLSCHFQIYISYWQINSETAFKSIAITSHHTYHSGCEWLSNKIKTNQHNYKPVDLYQPKANILTTVHFYLSYQSHCSKMCLKY